MYKYGALDPVFSQAEFSHIPPAVLWIVMKFFQIVISISVGLAAGCILAVGCNIGAGRGNRARQLFTRVLAAEVIVGAAALVIVEFFPRQLIGIFGAANESAYYTDFAICCFRVYLCMMPLAAVNKGSFIYLQAHPLLFGEIFFRRRRAALFRNASPNRGAFCLAPGQRL